MPKYIIYLQSEAKEEFKLLNSKDKGLFEKCINNLKEGLCNNGTRIKKLYSKVKHRCIYEARLDKARRLIFSIKNINVEDTAQLFIYKIACEHDKVNRIAKRILNDKDFNVELESDTISNKSEEKLTAKQIWDFENSECKEQDQIYSFIDNTTFFEMNDDEFIRFLYSDNSDDDLLDLKLRLTNEQVNVLNQKMPLIINGTAGSGKTTLLVYKLKENCNKKKLFITQNEKLCIESEKLFRKLIHGLDEENIYLDNTKFMSFEKYISENFKKEKFKILTKDEFVLKFNKYVKTREVLKSEFTALKAWGEIRGVIKSCKLTRDEYINTNNKYSSIPKTKRNLFFDKIYKEWYLALLMNEFYCDELDIIEKLLDEQKEIETFDMVLCDEVQDVTALHIKLLYKIVNRNVNQMVIAGDDNQVINNSGFTWKMVKNLFYNEFNIRCKDYRLTKNYRCTAEICNLADKVNKFERLNTDVNFKSVPAESYIQYDSPSLFYNIDESEVLECISYFGPNEAVIVNDEDVKRRLVEELKKYNLELPQIFTIIECKGLEFEKVFLWKLSSDCNEEWINIIRKINKCINLRTKEKDFIKEKCSLYYVAITRAIKNCYIYEKEKNNDFWKIDEIRQAININDKIDMLLELKGRSFTDEQWFNQGKKLFEERLFLQALQCFNRVIKLEVKNEYIDKCNAYIYENNEQFKEAAEIFKKYNMDKEFEKCLDNAGCYEDLVNWYYRKRGKDNDRKYYYYATKVYDEKLIWDKSALLCWMLKNYELSIDRYMKDYYQEMDANKKEQKMRKIKNLVNYKIEDNDVRMKIISKYPQLSIL